MALPNSRDQFITYCLRKLGAPVISIELDDNQISDRIDEALQKWQFFHMDGVERYYLKYQVLQTDIENEYITITDPLIISVLRVLELNQTSLNMFDARYQIRLNDFYNFNNVSMIHYQMTMQHLALLDFLFNSLPAIIFNQKDNKIYLQMDWQQDITVGQFIVFECYRAVDPTEFSTVWADHWLRRYATSLLKQQWGTNLKKYDKIQLSGGVTLNGQEIYDEASKEIIDLEAELKSTYELPIDFVMG